MKNIKIEIPEGYQVDEAKSTFTNIVFREIKKEITERIKTLQDAVDYLGEDDKSVIELRKNEDSSYQQLVCIVKALNEKYILDWGNSSERKWYSWWYLLPFRLYYVSYCNSNSDVPAALCFKSEELAEYTSKQFKDIYEQYMTNQV